MTGDTGEVYEAGLRSLEDCRWQEMLKLADFAEEHLHDPVLARGWRWLVENRRWPRESPPVYHWQGMAENILERHRLPLDAASHPDWLPVVVVVRMNVAVRAAARGGDTALVAGGPGLARDFTVSRLGPDVDFPHTRSTHLPALLALAAWAVGRVQADGAMPRER
jgi:hypothetical protein